METKKCNCIECGTEVEVTKFATPARVKCEGCKPKRKRTKKLMTVEELKAYAVKHYEQGGDGMIECWEDSQLQEFIDKHTSKTKSEALKLFKMWRSQSDDIQGQ